tara:strand:- start:558 stop:1007 length:450 start_codon:yes stop_codon:yes gene_type:complete
MGHILWFIVALIYGSIVEWIIHKYVFHGWGKKRKSMFAFHLREHHAHCIKNDFYDHKISKLEWGGSLFGIITHLPLYWICPAFFIGASLYAALFSIMHNYSHKDPEWCKKWIPWHYDHHMRYSNKNMNVVLPIADYLFGTRKKYLDKKL